MKRRTAILAVLLVLVLAFSALLSGCGKQYTCMRCGTDTSKAYYSDFMDKEHVLCEDCARPYWAPFSYKNYRVD